MRIFENWKLKYKILFVALLPILVVCIAVMVINNTVIKNTLLDKTKNELKATAEALSAAYKIQVSISKMMTAKYGKVHTMYHFHRSWLRK